MARKRKRKTKTVGWYIDEHQRLKDERDEIIQELVAKKAEIAEHADEALEHFSRDQIVGAKGDYATGYIEEKDVFKIEDRKKFDAYVRRTGHNELYQNRVNAEAYRELLALGKKPAGVEPFTVVNFRTRKR